MVQIFCDNMAVVEVLTTGRAEITPLQHALGIYGSFRHYITYV